MPPFTRVPKDLSGVRGFNYQSAATPHHTEHWLHYNPAHTDFELDLAVRLNLNQVRVFITHDAYAQGRAPFLERLLHFVRAAHVRHMGVMPTIMYPFDVVLRGSSAWPAFREFAQDLVQTVSPEPGLAFWDVSNEPDYTGRRGPEVASLRMDHARYMADLFHELDPVTPVTIGATFVPGMTAMADSMDVLSFHDYSSTRAEIRANIEKAKKFALQVGKPVFDTELGCLCRANPYDIALQEHMRAGIGWYIWELMITGQWGNVHGVFYQDGSVRDPSIAAAVLGFFRNRGPDIVPAFPDREGHVTRVVGEIEAWLAQDDADWEEGMRLAEVAAHLLEAGELVPMREPPTRQVYRLRDAEPEMPSLCALLRDFADTLRPYRRPD
ncbi:MAG: hypothetical protein JXA74_13720 [Anaerolineae bacterium]|nr:hypothetical protein [Anaerolineae bacterium]